MQGDSLDCTRQVHESRLHVVGQTRYVGCLQGVVRVFPVCMLVAPCDGQTGKNPGCSNMEPIDSSPSLV